MTRLAPLVAAFFASTALAAEAPSPRETADLLAPGQWSVGVFNPLRYGLTDSVELVGHPLLYLAGSPNVVVRVGHLEGPVRVTGEYGLSLPTVGARLMKGFFFPSWETSGDNVGWMLVPRAGVVVSGDVAADGVWTARADFAFRLPLGGNDAMPFESFLAPLDLVFAPALTGWRARVGVGYDHALSARLRGHGEVNVYATGRNPDGWAQPADVDGTGVPLYVSAHAGVDVALSEQARLTFGVIWYNYQQFATRLVTDEEGFSSFERTRSNNVLPTIDFIWTSGG